MTDNPSLDFLCIYQPLLADALLVIIVYTLAYCLIWPFRRRIPLAFAAVPLVIALPAAVVGHLQLVHIEATVTGGAAAIEMARNTVLYVLLGGAGASLLLAMLSLYRHRRTA